MSTHETDEEYETPTSSLGRSQINSREGNGQAAVGPNQGQMGEAIIYAGMPKTSAPRFPEREPTEKRRMVNYLIGGFRFDPSVPCLYQVEKAGKAPGVLVDPQPSDRAFRLLLLLVEHKGQVASREEIFKWVWGVGPRDLDPSNIHVLVCELRKALGRASIETLARRGYRIALEIIVIERPQRVFAEDERAITTVYGLSPERLQELIKAAVSDAFAAHNDGMGDLSYWLELPSL